MYSRQRTGQGAAASSQPATPTTRAAVTTASNPAGAAAPRQVAPGTQPGTEPTTNAGAASAPAPTPSQQQPEVPSSTTESTNPIATALADAATTADGENTAPEFADDASSLEAGAPTEPIGDTGAGPGEPSGELNGHNPAWLDAILNGDKTKVPHAIKQMARRIQQLTYQNRVSEQALAQVGPESEPLAGEAEVQDEARPDVRTPAAGTTPNADQQIQHTLQVLKWCERNPQGGSVTLKDGSLQEFTADQVADARVEHLDRLTTLRAQQAHTESTTQQQRTTRFEQARKEAATKYPWMANNAAPENREAHAYIQANREILSNPEWPLIVGRYVTGLITERKAATSRNAPPPTAPPLARPRATGAPAPVPGAPGAQAPRVDPLQKELQEAREGFKKSGSVKDKQKVLAIERRIKQAA